MKYSEYILEYLEGILDREKEAELFGELAVNEELRQEMSGQLIVARSVDTELHSLAPSPDVGNNIFEKMGFDAGTESKGTSRPLPIIFGGGQFIRNLLSGLAGCAITALLFLMFMPSERFDYPDQPAFTLNIQAPAEINYSKSSALENNASDISGSSAIPVIENHESYNHNVSGSIAKQEQNVSPVLSETSIPDDNDNEITSNSNYTIQIPARVDNSQNQIPYVNTGITLSATDQDKIYEIGHGFALTHRNIVSSSIANVPKSLAGNKTDFLSDRAFGAEIRIGEEHFVGVEVGRENFFLEYETGIETGKIMHRQNPDLFWGGVFYKFVPLTDSPVKPYVRGFGRSNVNRADSKACRRIELPPVRFIP